MWCWGQHHQCSTFLFPRFGAGTSCDSLFFFPRCGAGTSFDSLFFFQESGRKTGFFLPLAFLNSKHCHRPFSSCRSPQAALKFGEGIHAGARPARSPKNRDEMRGLVFAAAAHLACDLKNCAGGDIPWPVLVLFVPGSPHVTLIELRLAPRFVPGLPHVTLIELRLALVSYQDYHMLP